MVLIRATSPSPLVYRIDAGDRLTYVSPEWMEEAQSWPSARLAPGEVIGRSLWECLCDAAVREIYAALIVRVRDGRTVKFTYRCDTPDRRRLYQLRISLVGSQEVEFVSKLQKEEARPVVALLDPAHPRERDRTLPMCSWCHRVALPVDFWVPIEDAAQVGGLMEANPLPRLLPGACPECRSAFEKKLKK